MLMFFVHVDGFFILHIMVVLLDPHDNQSNSDQDGLQDVIIIGCTDEEKKDKNRKENRFCIMPVSESRKENNDEEGTFVVW